VNPKSVIIIKTASNFITRAEHDYLCKEIESLKLSRAALQCKADQKSVTTSMIIGIIGLVAIVARFL
jgi:hypothetical protein